MPSNMSPADRIARLDWPEGPIRAVLDTDTFNEIDDQFAVVQTLLSPDRIQLEAIYAAPFHNDRSNDPGHGMELSYDEILRLLERLEISAEGLVHRGVSDYVGAERRARPGDAVDDLIGRARAMPDGEQLYVIAIAAISNIASALIAAPDIAGKIVVVWLGGHALEWPHTREFNLRQDIGGAQHLFDCGVPLILVPCMGVTSHLHASIPEIERHVAPHGAIGRFLADRFIDYADEPLGFSKEIWDMAPVGWLLNEHWVSTTLAPTPILSTGATWSTDRSRHPMRYATHVKRDPILRDFFGKLARFHAR